MTILIYTIYLVISLTVTVLVGKHLHKHGYFLILDLFKNEQFTKAVNNFLLIGYYLINLGYVALTIQSIGAVNSFDSGLERLAEKIGFILLVLGFMHLANILGLKLISTKRERIIKMFNQ